MVSLFENFFSEDTVTRVAYKYDTHSSHYQKSALCSSQSAVAFLLLLPKTRAWDLSDRMLMEEQSAIARVPRVVSRICSAYESTMPEIILREAFTNLVVESLVWDEEAIAENMDGIRYMSHKYIASIGGLKAVKEAAIENKSAYLEHMYNVCLESGKKIAKRKSAETKAKVNKDNVDTLYEQLKAAIVKRKTEFDHFIDFLEKQLKISTYTMQPNLTIALGSGDVSIGEMASAYTIFPSMGIHYSPLLVTRIEDAEGNVIANFTPRMNEVLSKEKASQMIYMLKAVINEGTGRALRGGAYHITGDLGGKTGTTNSNADGWFIGFCPKLVVASWVGGEDRDIHFGSMAFGQGARAALPIFGKLMRKIYNSKLFGISEKDKFDIPEDYQPCENELMSLPSAEGLLNPVEEDQVEYDEAFF